MYAYMCGMHGMYDMYDIYDMQYDMFNLLRLNMIKREGMMLQTVPGVF